MGHRGNAYLEGHGVGNSQEDAEGQCGFVGAMTPEAMRSSCDPQSTHHETQKSYKGKKGV